MHWINALAMILMVASGWEIYNDEVILGWLHFPHWLTIGGGAEGALQWHFAAMWLLMINGLCYLVYGFATGRFRRITTADSSSGYGSCIAPSLPPSKSATRTSAS